MDVVFPAVRGEDVADYDRAAVIGGIVTEPQRR